MISTLKNSIPRVWADGYVDQSGWEIRELYLDLAQAEKIEVSCSVNRELAIRQVPSVYRMLPGYRRRFRQYSLLRSSKYVLEVPETTNN